MAETTITLNYKGIKTVALTLRYPVAWYCRKSDNKSDLARQRNLLIGWCLKHEVAVPDHLRFEDTGSRNKSSKRPQFLKMMEMVRRRDPPACPHAVRTRGESP